MSKNIIVAGLGHGGIAAAALLARNGYKVTVYEAKKADALGYDWTDIFDPKALDVAGVPMPDESLFEYKEDMTFSGPGSQKSLLQHVPEDEREIKMERSDIYKLLVDNAIDAGVEIVYECKVKGPIMQGDRVIGIKTSKGDFYGDMVIDACGMNSPVRCNLPKALGIQGAVTRQEKITIYRAFYNKGSDVEVAEKFKVILYAGGKPGISWVASEDEYTDVLIGRFGNFDKTEVKEFTDFLRRTNPRIGKKKLRGGQFVEIPVRHTLSVMVADGYAAIGDSAFMTVPLIGSGIANALKASRILADTIMADENGFYSAETLWDYQVKYHKSLGGGLAPLECVRRALLDLTPQDVDYAFDKDVISADDITMSSEFTSVAELASFDMQDMKNKVKGVAGNPHLIKVVSKAGVKLAKVIALSSKMPTEYCRADVIKWARKYDKAFE